MNHQEITIQNGTQQINPAATQAVQNNYILQPLSEKPSATPRTVVILGAGADAAVGFPPSHSLMPCIVDWLETDLGKTVDTALRKILKRLTFRFDKFVNDAIDRLAKDLDKERDSICHNIRRELQENPHLDEEQRKLGRLIVRIFQQITDLKNGATIDEETENMVRELLGTEITDATIIDFSRVNYTDTFKQIIVEILQRSMRDAGHPVLRHVYHNLLDIEQLLAQYFYGFYAGKPSLIKTYLYISWILWAYLVHKEQEIAKAHTVQPSFMPVYEQLRNKKDLQLITFNYTTLAAQASPSALYFHGNLTDYVDIENKNDLHIDDLHTLDLTDFFHTRLPGEMSLEGERIAIPTPSFIPPLKLKPIISRRYITIWYHSAEAISHADKILILGHSLHTCDDYFHEMLRDNRNAEIIVIDRDMEAVCHNLCSTLQQSPTRYTTLTVQGHLARKYDNRITVIQADLKEIDLAEWVN